MMNIRNVDLNLLPIFEVLMHERSVTRTASRLCLSQPAVSAALKRLREQVGDPLLIRTRTGMRPTPRAEQIFASVSQALDAIQNSVQTGAAFAPADARRSFNVMMSDIGEIVYLPRLIRQLQLDAPAVRLSVKRLARPRVHDELAAGTIDLAIGWMEPGDDLRREELFDETFVGIVRPDHPRIGRRLTQNQFMTEWHLVVGRHDFGSDTYLYAGQTQHALAHTTAQRKIAIQVPHFLAVPNIVANTDLVCIVPRQLGQVYAEYGQVRIVPLPFKSVPFTVSQFWHDRFDRDQGNIWLRAVIKALFAAKKA
ncbi:MAG TPA: LysR family transcriptional regulator [Pseudolabrys sp.]|nr:LysR family transcriptional regulator [Pseudolabrys sp.]